MISFQNYLSEAADSAQNLHLTHADEDLFERGDLGAQAAVDSITDFAKTVGKGRTKLTVKWDGAPAIFAGWDPADGKFFVGTKSVFAKNPKVYKTHEDIVLNEKGGKAEKLKVALEELPKVGIPKGTVLQGDMMFTKGDQRYETIDGVRYITVHPNTIVYAWPSESDIGKRIRNANMGIVWHTTYKGRGSLSNYRASFGVDVNKLKQTRTCWQDDAYFKGVDIAFTDGEYKNIFSNAMKAQGLIGGFDRIVEVMDTLASAQAGANIKTYINSKIRGGNIDISFAGYMSYLDVYWQKHIDKVKTEAAKDSKKAALRQFKEDLKNIQKIVSKAFMFVEYITKAKMLVVDKLNEINKQKSFVMLQNGDFKVTAPEGYVAVDSQKGEAVKFVDRLSFSHFNFSPDYKKGWQR